MHTFLSLSLSVQTQSWDKVKKMVQAWSPFSLQFCKKKYNWVQLAGHKGESHFAPVTSGPVAWMIW